MYFNPVCVKSADFNPYRMRETGRAAVAAPKCSSDAYTGLAASSRQPAINPPTWKPESLIIHNLYKSNKIDWYARQGSNL